MGSPHPSRLRRATFPQRGKAFRLGNCRGPNNHQGSALKRGRRGTPTPLQGQPENRRNIRYRFPPIGQKEFLEPARCFGAQPSKARLLARRCLLLFSDKSRPPEAKQGIETPSATDKNDTSLRQKAKRPARPKGNKKTEPQGGRPRRLRRGETQISTMPSRGGTVICSCPKGVLNCCPSTTSLA